MIKSTKTEIHYNKDNLIYHSDVPDSVVSYLKLNPKGSVKVTYNAGEYEDHDMSVDDIITTAAYSCTCNCTTVELN